MALGLYIMSKSVREAELEHRTAEYINYVKDFAANTNRDMVLKSERDGFRFSLFDKDCTLEFSV